MPERSSIPRQPRFLAGCVIAAAVVIGLGGLGIMAVLAMVDDIGKANRELDGALTAYRAAGLPWEGSEVRKHVPLEDSENAAKLLRQAIAGVPSTKFNKIATGIIKDFDTNSLDSASESLKPYDSSLNIAVLASQKSKLDFNRDFDLGPTLLFPEEAELKAIEKGLAFRAEIEAKRHQGASAIRDLTAGWRIANLIDQEPTMIDMLVSIACKAICLRRVEICAASFRHNPEFLKQLSSALAEGSAPDFPTALKGEAFMGVATIRNLKGLGGIQSIMDPDFKGPRLQPKDVIRSGMPEDRTARAFMTRHLQSWTALQIDIQSGKYTPDKLGARMDALAKEYTSKHLASYVLESILFPVFQQAGIAAVKSEAERTAMRALLDALQQYPADKKLPDSVKGIGNGKWIDPFTHEPMKVLHEDGSFRVYSVGPSEEDHHGVFQTEVKSTTGNDYDIGAAYPPRRHR